MLLSVIFKEILNKTGLNINIRENRRGNQILTIKRNWQHWVHKIKTIRLYASQHNCMVCA